MSLVQYKTIANIQFLHVKRAYHNHCPASAQECSFTFYHFLFLFFFFIYLCSLPFLPTSLEINLDCVSWLPTPFTFCKYFRTSHLPQLLLLVFSLGHLRLSPLSDISLNSPSFFSGRSTYVSHRFRLHVPPDHSIHMYCTHRIHNIPYNRASSNNH